MDEDFFLINRMKRGDDEAVEQLVKKYYGDILKYSYRHMFGSSEAEDITQETFVKFFEHFESYKHYGKVKNYLYVIAGNLCKNYYKKNQQEIYEPIIEEIFNETEQSETKIDLENALKKLQEEYREVLILYYFHDIKQKEIAKILNISLPLVKYRILKGKEQLKTILEEEEGDGYDRNGMETNEI